MNFGQNVFTWLQGNMQPLVLTGLLCMGAYAFIERKFSKLAGLLVIGVIAVGFVFFTSDVKDLLGQLFMQIFK